MSRKLADLLESSPIFTDGDWVESKDQDPDGDVRLIQLADIGTGAYLNKSARFLTSAKAQELKCTFLRSGDLLIARMPDPLGRACIFPGDAKKAVTVVDVCIVRPDPEVVDGRWLMWYLNSDIAKTQMHRVATGTTRLRISRKNLGALTVDIPSLPQQIRIAAVLDQVSTLRAKRREAIALLDNLTQSIFLDMFGNPVKNDGNWPVRPFGDICETRLGKMLDASRQTGQNARPYLRNANVQWFHIDTTDLLEMDFSETDRITYGLTPGDVMICEGGEPGRAAIWQGEISDCYFQKALHRARPRKGLANPEYIVWLLRMFSILGGLSDHISTATIAHLTGAKLKNLPIPAPPAPMQEDFARRIEQVEAAKRGHLTQLAALDELFVSLQHRAFSGTLWDHDGEADAA